MSNPAKKWQEDCLAAAKIIEDELKNVKDQLLLIERNPYGATMMAEEKFKELQTAVNNLGRKFKSDSAPRTAETPA